MADARSAAGSQSEGSTRLGPADAVFAFVVLCVMGLLTFATYNISHALGWITAGLLVAYVIYAGWRDGRQGPAAGAAMVQAPPTDDPRPPTDSVPGATRTPVA